MNDPIILDTCVFFDRSFINGLKKYHGRIIVPAVAYCELLYSCNVKNKNIDKLFGALSIEIEEFDARKAALAVKLSEGWGKWKENCKDYMIGAHANPAPRKLITFNVNDFEFLGDRVIEPYKLLDMV